MYSPFGKRCHAIHDPRVAGSEQSWLPHTETQGNTIDTDINVDALHQKRLYSILHNNPFGEFLDLESASFEKLYNIICNSNKKFSVESGNRQKKKGVVLQEHHKLSIALKMRGGSNFHFKFRPQHIIYDKICMVLQKRAFRLTEEDAIEIPVNMFRPSLDILVREIAFGPDCDSSVPGVGLWFTIDESDVTVCTPQQAKRYRWKRGTFKKYNETEEEEKHSTHSSRSYELDKQCSFTMVRPSEEDAYSLSTAILDHRLAVIKAERIPNICEKAIELDRLEQQRLTLKDHFNGMVRGWTNWSWPVNKGREKVDDTTAVPPVDGCYEVTKIQSTAVTRIWESFVTFLIDSLHYQHQGYLRNQDFKFPTNQGLDREVSRLSVFKNLAEGSSVPCREEDNRVFLPHINENQNSFQMCGSRILPSQRCWKALLLKSTPEKEYTEWEIVRHHFQNSRSRKIISILQQ